VVTHAHPEAVAGAIAVAVAAAWAWRLRGTEPPGCPGFLDLIRPHIPDSVVAEKVRHARDLDPDASVGLAVAALGNGERV
jgi:ADP-ribosylglycohydrolase